MVVNRIQKEKEQSTYVNYIIKLRRSKLAYLFLILAILPRVIWMLKNKLPSIEILGFNLNKAFDITHNGFSLLHWNLLKILSLISIFIVISIFEFTGSWDIRKLSIFRTKFSVGGRLADFYYYFISLFAFKFKHLAIISTLGLAQVSDTFSGFLTKTFDILIPDSLESALIPLFVVAILLSELDDYTTHRIAHVYFWELHEFHHSATEMTIFSVKRNSILGEVVPSIPSKPIFILSLSIINHALIEGQWIIFILYLIYEVVGELFGYIGHSSTKIIFPKPFSYLFMSPSLHWIHHSSNPKHFNKNFGSVLTIWDRVFGTYLNESHLKEIKSFGLINSEYNKYHPLYCFFILPARKMLRKHIRKSPLTTF